MKQLGGICFGEKCKFCGEASFHLIIVMKLVSEEVAKVLKEISVINAR